MLTGMRLGPKAEAETQRALQLDPNCAHAYAVIGRRQLYAPKMFGGDVAKAIESFQKSLSMNPSQDETWIWLCKAFQKQGDKSKAREAVQRALTLNPDSPWVKETANSIDKK